LKFLGLLTKRPFLQAFDSANNFLGIVYYAGALPTGCCFEVGPTETLTFTSTANNIAYVQFSSQNPTNPPPSHPATFGLFDNLRFDALYTLAANAVGGGTVSVSPSQPTYPDFADSGLRNPQPAANQGTDPKGLHYAGSFGSYLGGGDFRRRLLWQLQL
jgi:hypothetical protein